MTAQQEKALNIWSFIQSSRRPEGGAGPPRGLGLRPELRLSGRPAVRPWASCCPALGFASLAASLAAPVGEVAWPRGSPRLGFVSASAPSQGGGLASASLLTLAVGTPGRKGWPSSRLGSPLSGHPSPPGLSFPSHPDYLLLRQGTPHAPRTRGRRGGWGGSGSHRRGDRRMKTSRPLLPSCGQDRTGRQPPPPAPGGQWLLTAGGAEGATSKPPGPPGLGGPAVARGFVSGTQDPSRGGGGFPRFHVFNLFHEHLSGTKSPVHVNLPSRLEQVGLLPPASSRGGNGGPERGRQLPGVPGLVGGRGGAGSRPAGLRVPGSVCPCWSSPNPGHPPLVTPPRLLFGKTRLFCRICR